MANSNNDFIHSPYEPDVIKGQSGSTPPPTTPSILNDGTKGGSSTASPPDKPKR